MLCYTALFYLSHLASSPSPLLSNLQRNLQEEPRHGICYPKGFTWQYYAEKKHNLNLPYCIVSVKSILKWSTHTWIYPCLAFPSTSILLTVGWFYLFILRVADVCFLFTVEFPFLFLSSRNNSNWEWVHVVVYFICPLLSLCSTRFHAQLVQGSRRYTRKVKISIHPTHTRIYRQQINWGKYMTKRNKTFSTPLLLFSFQFFKR